MKIGITVAILSFLWIVPAVADNGILKKSSPHSVAQTAERLEQAARDRGMMVFPRFDHQAAARAYDREMPPAVVVSIGNPKYGTPFMVTNPVSGIDFPPKAIVYQDGEGQVWIAYNSADYLYGTIFKRHGLTAPEGDVAFYADLLEQLTDHAVAKEPG